MKEVHNDAFGDNDQKKTTGISFIDIGSEYIKEAKIRHDEKR